MSILAEAPDVLGKEWLHIGCILTPNESESKASRP